MTRPSKQRKSQKGNGNASRPSQSEIGGSELEEPPMELTMSEVGFPQHGHSHSMSDSEIPVEMDVEQPPCNGYSLDIRANEIPPASLGEWHMNYLNSSEELGVCTTGNYFFKLNVAIPVFKNEKA